jgi:CBS domain-containing protein
VRPPTDGRGGRVLSSDRMATIEPIAYVRSVSPFAALPAAEFETAARSLEIGFYPAGTRLATAGGLPLEHLYVVRKGAVCLEHDGQTLQVIEEGECFGYPSLISGHAAIDVIVDEDLLAYRLPGREFRRLLGNAPFAGHFAVGLADRLRSSLAHGAAVTAQPDLSVEVGRLLERPAVWVEEGVTVAEAARVMREQRISSVLVRSDPPGIVTDRDFRNRVLAEGLGPRTPVARVLTKPLRVVQADAQLHEAWTALLDAHVHHLPVVRGDEIVGMLSSGDLLRCSAQGPIAVLRGVERLAGRDGLRGYADRLAEMAAALDAANVDAPTIGGLVARLNDTLLGRLVRWAEGELGAAPAPWAWLALGSEGRMEQTLLTDQDNALVYDDAGEPHRAWFQAFAERVNADLLAAGFPPCPGGRMARSWSGSISWWREEIDRCVEERPAAAAILYDLRRAAGALDLSPLAGALERGARTRHLSRALARDALRFTPPAAVLLRLHGKSSEIDLKRQGIAPVAMLARCYAVEVGSSARATLERLEAARAAGTMADRIHAAVSEAYRFLLALRLRQQLRAFAEHRPLVDNVTLRELSGAERTRLKDSFRAIREWQEKATYHYQTDLV